MRLSGFLAPAAALLLAMTPAPSPAMTFDQAMAAYERNDYAAAYRGFRGLAEQGDAEAQYNLGLMYDGGEGVPQDYAEAARWHRRAAEQDHAEAQYDLGFMYAAGKGVLRDDAEAARWFRRAAEQGHASAQLNLGLMYFHGAGVPQDDAEAARWHRRAAEQGVAKAQFNLGFMYYEGTGVPQDAAEAARWYRRAAEQGHALAQFNLGLMYYEGTGIPQDAAEAARWHRRAAERSVAEVQSNLELMYVAEAQFNLGFMYYEGTGVPQDAAEAARWYLGAAEQGVAKAQFNLGVMYYEGAGVPQDAAEAARWLSRAAEQGGTWARYFHDAARRGHAEAHFSLGLMYDAGNGVREDDAEAARWYRRAAEGGHPFAQYKLGEMYDAGEGVPLDLIRAHKWFNLAASRIPATEIRAGAARKRDRVAERLTAAQLSRARRLARRWRPRTDAGRPPAPAFRRPGITPAPAQVFEGAVVAYHRNDHARAKESPSGRKVIKFHEAEFLDYEIIDGRVMSAIENCTSDAANVLSDGITVYRVPSGVLECLGIKEKIFSNPYGDLTCGEGCYPADWGVLELKNEEVIIWGHESLFGVEHVLHIRQDRFIVRTLMATHRRNYLVDVSNKRIAYVTDGDIVKIINPDAENTDDYKYVVEWVKSYGGRSYGNSFLTFGWYDVIIDGKGRILEVIRSRGR